MSSLHFSYLESDDKKTKMNKTNINKLDLNKTRKNSANRRITNDYIKKLQKDMTDNTEVDDDEDTDIPYLKEDAEKPKPPSIARFQPPPNPQVHSKKELPETGVHNRMIDDSNGKTSINTNHISESDAEYTPTTASTVAGQNSYTQQYDPTSTMQSYIPYYNNATNTSPSFQSRDDVVSKLNYLIHLLEEQQEQKTGHVMEELILYCFLGVFIIFVLDSFVKVGKYTR